MNQRSNYLGTAHSFRWATLSLLFLLVPAAIAAHEVVPLRKPTSTGGSLLIPIVTPADHLTSLPVGGLDFGQVVSGQSLIQTVTATNVSAQSLTVTVEAAAPYSASPASFSLAPAQTLSVEVTFSPAAVGAFSGDLVFHVLHSGVGTAWRESVPLTGSGWIPPKLRFDIPSFGEVDVSALDFGLASTEDVGAAAPSLEVVVTNVGSITAEGVTVIVPGPGAQLADKICHEGLDTAAICLSKVEGGTRRATGFLGDIPPGASVLTRWEIQPAEAGALEVPFDVTLANGATQVFSVLGEIIPFTIPDSVATSEGLFRAPQSGSGGTGLKALGDTVDPLGEDSLATFRPVSFDARTFFSVGEIDTVDLRAGNLTAVIPIGGPQAVRGSLSYQLQAVFNGTIWSRKTLGELELAGPQGERLRPKGGEYLNPTFNTGAGWSFHLGRLLPPFLFDGIPLDPNICLGDPLQFEKSVDTGPRFVYIGPDGTSHEFWLNLHGDEDFASGSYAEKAIQYSRDGSYLRLVRDSGDPNTRWVEEPGGMRRKFVLQSTPHPTLPDSWRLEAIEDPYGNQVTLVYGATSWTLVTPWNQVRVDFASWPGRTARDPMMVDQVVLPGFGGVGPERIYDFQYTPLTLERPDRFSGAGGKDFYDALKTVCPGLDLTVKTQRLDRIRLPDGSSYELSYATPLEDRLRLEQIALPTGGFLQYEHELVWDSPPDCENRDLTFPTFGVSRRKVLDAGGAVLADRRYLRQTRRTDDVPDTICQYVSLNDQSNASPPWSEQWVVVWDEIQAADVTAEAHPNGLSSASAHYFSIFPYKHCGAVRKDQVGNILPGPPGCSLNAAGTTWVLDSGRSNIERNLKISRDPAAGSPAPGVDGSQDPLLGTQLHLSEELYSCEFDLAPGGGTPTITRGQVVTARTIGDDIPAFLARCARKERTYASFEVERAGHLCLKSSPYCLRDSRLRDSRIVHEDDGGKWTRVTRGDFDGLGHYRSTLTRSNFQTSGGPNANSTVVQESFQSFNPGVGTLVLFADHRVSQNIAPPNTWLLGSWDYRWVREGSDGRGAEAVFHPTQGHLLYQRTWNQTGALSTGAGTWSNNRTVNDLVVRHVVDAQGQLREQHFFGADTYSRGSALPTGDSWMNDGNWSSSWQDYALLYTYDAGRLASRRVDGDSLFELRTTIDHSTGWVATETRDTGEELTLSYNRMGRIEWIESPLTASRSFDYDQEIDGRWRMTSRFHPKGTGPTTLNPTVLGEYSARYDGLGRIRQETFPLYNDNPAGVRRQVSRNIQYHRGGAIAAVDSVDDPSRKDRFEVDFRGRPARRVEPDTVSKTAWSHLGSRETLIESCVRTGGPGSGICTGINNQRVTTSLQRDWKGRIVKTVSPEGFQTAFTYNPQDHQTTATRSQGASSQTRAWGFNGLGFQVSESLPEKVATTFSSFNTRGQPRQADEGVGPQRRTTFVYDRLGRLLDLSVGSQLIKTFRYHTTCVAGQPATCDTTSPTNGRLREAVRFNRRGAGESGVGGGVPGSWKVTSTFGYDPAGRPATRSTSIVFFDLSGAEASGTTTFQQGWGYDDLGNLASLSYPTCLVGSDCRVGRTVSYTHGQGHFLTSVSTGESTLGASLTYHPSGLLHRVNHNAAFTHGSDIYGVSLGMPRISSIQLAIGSFDSINLGTVSYDGSGNIHMLGPDSFLYDRNSRLVQSTVQGQSFTYGYDLFDNLDETRQGPFTVSSDTNQILGVGWNHDPFGNLTDGSLGAGNPVKIVYDELDKVTKLQEPSGTARLSIYDHDDLRVLSMRTDDPTPLWTLRDGLQVIRELTGSGGSIARRKDYLYAASRLISSKAYPSGEERHYHEDQVGSARLYTPSDAAGGPVHYGPYGEEFATATSGEAAVSFQGHEDDGLATYMRGRTYLPMAGRFLQVDPRRSAGSWSLYAFAQNNPMAFIDPSGRCPAASDSEDGSEGSDDCPDDEDEEGAEEPVDLSDLPKPPADEIYSSINDLDFRVPRRGEYIPLLEVVNNDTITVLADTKRLELLEGIADDFNSSLILRVLEKVAETEVSFLSGGGSGATGTSVAGGRSFFRAAFARRLAIGKLDDLVVFNEKGITILSEAVYNGVVQKVFDLGLRLRRFTCPNCQLFIGRTGEITRGELKALGLTF